jgi:hypothetical protein
MKPNNQPPPGKVAVLDHKLRYVGHVTTRASSIVADRLLGRRGSKMKNGAWVGARPNNKKQSKNLTFS